MAYSEVKEVAVRANIPVYQPIKLKEDRELIEKLKEMKPDFIIVVAFGQILTQEILDIPNYGCINLHGSLLPMYRGAAPINWAVIKGEKISGNRIFYDAEVATQSPWNFAINCSEDINVHMNEVLGNPFDKKYNPLVMSLKAKKIENWKEENNSAGNIPFSPVKTDSPEEIVKLIPYGTARLRISEFPYYE